LPVGVLWNVAEALGLGGHRTSRTVWWEHEVEAAMEEMANRGRRPE